MERERKIISTGVELRTGRHSESIRICFMYRGVECREGFRLSHTKQNKRTQSAGAAK